ncbi:MAG: ribose-phosphate pyrophosphokinase-like domain-containing protein [Patescibacteria group bacterium]|jgi:ribose-phosphate pyrophosphokinase
MNNTNGLNGNGFEIVSGRSNPELVKSVAKGLNVEPIFIDTKPWGNGYPRCIRPDDVTFLHKKVFIVTSLRYHELGSPVDELELMFDACGSASEIHIILTWFCTKDDISHNSGHTPTTTWIANRIKNLGPKSVNCFDLHQSSHLEFFYPIRRRRFYFLRLLIENAKKLGIGQIAATDDSSSKRARKVEEFLKTNKPYIVATKDHDHKSENSQVNFHKMSGEILADKVCLFDDMALSLSTIKRSAESLKKMGVKEVYAAAPHFDPTSTTYENLKECFENGWLTRFTTTNSNVIDEKFLGFGKDKFEVLDVSGFVSDVIRSIIKGESTSSYFDDI